LEKERPLRWQWDAAAPEIAEGLRMEGPFPILHELRAVGSSATSLGLMRRLNLTRRNQGWSGFIRFSREPAAATDKLSGEACQSMDSEAWPNGERAGISFGDTSPIGRVTWKGLLPGQLRLSPRLVDGVMAAQKPKCWPVGARS